MNELNLTQLFLLDGKPIVAPDEDVEMSFEDLDAATAHARGHIARQT